MFDEYWYMFLFIVYVLVGIYELKFVCWEVFGWWNCEGGCFE